MYIKTASNQIKFSSLTKIEKLKIASEIYKPQAQCYNLGIENIFQNLNSFTCQHISKPLASNPNPSLKTYSTLIF